VRVARGPATWAKRAFVAIVLVGAAVIPGRASSGEPQHCAGIRCTAAGSILWTAGLPGLWLAQPGVSGTVPGKVGAYAATGGGVAVIAAGTGVTAFDERTGKRLWRVPLTGLPAGSAVVGVRAFQQVIAVGVAPPARLAAASRSRSQRSGQSRAGASRHVPSGAGRYEVILSAATGRQIRIYPAATYGGAVAADSGRTVIVGTDAITAYENATGRVRWSRAIGPAGQAWRVTGDMIYLAGASADAGGRTTLRRIDLRTGAEVKRTLSTLAGTPPGSLSDAAGDVVLFSGSAGVAAYDGSTGKLLWCMANSPSCHTPRFADVELADSGQPASAYLASGNRLLGVNMLTGKQLSSAPISVASSLYAVISGVALGLDEDGLGEAWGYNLATRRIVWTSASLPWPHYFVDLSGLGGSISPGSTIALLTTCADVGAALSANSAPVCRRPELEAIRT
jgi:outer membrane protein assembly factor BamB